jgi:hypothetical protein
MMSCDRKREGLREPNSLPRAAVLRQGRLVDEYQDAARRIVGYSGEPAARGFLTCWSPVTTSAPARSDSPTNEAARTRHSTLCTTWKPADPVVRGWLVDYLKMELDEP